MNLKRASRGQSEALGFILIFSVVLLSIGSIYVSGIASLDTHRATSELNNAEQAMLVFSSNVEDIIQQESPRRSVEMKTTESYIQTTARHNVTVSVDGTEAIDTSIRGFAYRGEAGDLVYMSGALIRSQDGGATMRDTPLFHFSDDRVILNVIRLAGQAEYRGSGTSLAVLDHDTERDSASYSISETEQTVTITLETPPDHAQAWMNYFEAQGLDQVNFDPDQGTVNGRYSGTKEVFVRVNFVWVSIEE